MRRDLPTGTVTFVFTDIEGSTKLLSELGAERYGELLARHHAVSRSAWAVHGGVEVDTAGDAFFVAFRSAAAALRAATEAQDGLAELGLRVRMGVHTGEVSVNETGYIGFEVHRAARIAAAAHGGQVVVSETTAAAAGRDGLVELGEHRFKDLDEPVAIFQLRAGTFPPLKSLSNTNLPRPASSFVGRDVELGEVLSRFEQGSRLLTLTGPGGSGKTRLALEAAATLVPEFKAGVFWVGLAALRDPALVTETIEQTLGAKDGLAEHIGERELLLLLDNLEQVIEAAPELSSLLRACPNVRLLVTSRELLHVDGEVEYAVPPLAEPEAVALFCERAQAEPSDAIRELCVRLDHLPLAVELAAARTKALSPAQILERLSQRLDLLKGGRDADPRQRTLRATIDWSYELLDEDEKRLFRALSVFAGGCTLDAAEQVADADLDTLQSLVEKSLLRFTNQRYWMLETIREYGVEQLCAAGEAEETFGRFTGFFVALAEKAERELTTHRGPAWFAALDHEADNLSAVIRRAADAGDGSVPQRVIGALWRFYERRSGVEILRTLSASLALPGAEPDLRGKALFAGARLAFRCGAFEDARPWLEESRAVFEQTGSIGGVATAVAGLGWVELETGAPTAAVGHTAEAVATARRVGEGWILADALNNHGCALLAVGDVDGAELAHSESLRLREAVGEAEGIAASHGNLAEVARAQGDWELARSHYDYVLSAARSRGDLWATSMALGGLMLLELDLGNRAHAAKLGAEALALAEEHGFRRLARDHRALGSAHDLEFETPSATV